MGIRYIFLDESENEKRIDFQIFGFNGATNNQMELKAVIEGIRKSIDQPIEYSYNRIEVRTDSRYVVDNISNAIYKWSKNKWLKGDGRPVENAPLWKDLVKVIKIIGCRVEIKWVKGHGKGQAKDIDNDAVDKLAKSSAKGWLNKPIFRTKLRKKLSSEKTRIGSIEMKGQRISIHIINDSYLNLQGLSKYRYEVISKSSEYYKKVDIIFSEHHHMKSGHYYLVTFNKDTKNPRILKVINELEKGTMAIKE